MKKNIFILCIVCCFSPFCAEAAWYDAELEELQTKQFIASSHFQNPDAPILREEICDILVSLYRYQNPDVETELKQNSFTDTAASPYKEAIDTAYSLGFIKGESAELFNGKGTLTREQFATIIYRMHGSPMSPVRAYRDEPDISKYALEGIDYCVQQGIVKGTAKDFFSPKKSLTKAEALAMIRRLLNAEPQKENAQLLRYVIEDKNTVYMICLKDNELVVIDKNNPDRKSFTFDNQVAGQIFDMGDSLLIPTFEDEEYAQIDNPRPQYQNGYIFDKASLTYKSYSSPPISHPFAFYNGALYFNEYNGMDKSNKLGKFVVETGEVSYSEPLYHINDGIYGGCITNADGGKVYGSLDYPNTATAFEVDLDSLEVTSNQYPESQGISFVGADYTAYWIYENGKRTSRLAMHDTQTGEKLKELDLTETLGAMPEVGKTCPAYDIDGEMYMEDKDKKRLVCITDRSKFDICTGLNYDLYSSVDTGEMLGEIYCIDGSYFGKRAYTKRVLKTSCPIRAFITDNISQAVRL